jgi:nucleotide-binding universal stress UspA family protein
MVDAPIVLGMDSSDGARRALEWARDQALKDGTEIIAVHVLTYSRELFNDLPPLGLHSWRESRATALRDEWTKPLRDVGVRYSCRMIEDDNIAEGLMRVAREQEASLIVVGAHGRGWLSDRVLGSTTYNVMHRALRPVVVVPLQWGEH